MFQLDDPLGGIRLHGDNGDAEFFGNFRWVKAETGFLRDIDHIQGEDAGLAEFDNLENQLEMALEVRGIDDADDEVGFCRAFEFPGEGVEGDFFIWRICAERVATGKIKDVDLGSHVRIGFTGFHLNGDASEVSDALVFPGECVKKGGFPGVRISDQGNRRWGVRRGGHRKIRQGGLADRGNEDLLCKITADGHSRSAKGANEVTAVGEFAQLHLLAEAEIPKAVACRAAEAADTDVAVQPHLIQGDGTFRWAVWCLGCRHRGKS